MSQETNDEQDFPKFTCNICQKESEVFQLSVFDDLEFWSCYECGSVRCDPFPDKADQRRQLNESFYATRSVFYNSREKKHFENHVKELANKAKGKRGLNTFARNGLTTNMMRLAGFTDVTGQETNKFCNEVAEKRFSKCKFTTDTLQKHAKSGEIYNAVVSYKDIEQYENPDEFFSHLAKLGDEKTLYYLSLCDGNHFMVPNDFLKWEEVYFPEKAHYISREGLDILAKRNGFKIVKRYKRFLPYQHVIMKKVKAKAETKPKAK